MIAAVEECIGRARRQLAHARQCLHDLRAATDSRRKLMHLQTVVVFGVSVTHVLQNLRSIVQDFDGWWADKQRSLRQDPLVRYLYTLRSEILKEGRLRDVLATSNIVRLQVPDDLGPPPPNAVGYYVRGSGTGWRIQLPDGSIEQIPVLLPEEKVTYWVELAGCPREHQGQALADVNAETVCGLYLSFLERILDEAASHPWRLA